MNRKFLFIGTMLLLVAVFIVGTLVYRSEQTQQTTQNVDRNQGKLVQFYSPVLGDPNAKVHIVEFLDPACETCAVFYPYVKQMMAASPDRIRLTVRHVPFHTGSDQVVRILEASRKQGKYWQALEAVLKNQNYWVKNHAAQPDQVWQTLEGLGLNIEQVKVDMNAPDIAQRIAQDQSDARALNVTKTPTYFVNGRPLPSFGLEQLRTLVKDAERAAYR